MTNRTLLDRLHAGLLYALSGILIAASFAMLAIIFHYNHWVGWISRLTFIAIGILAVVLILVAFEHAFDDYPNRQTFGEYWKSLTVVALIIIGLFYVSGWTVHMKTPCYDIRSGRLATFDKVEWHNPLDRTVVLINQVQKVYTFGEFTVTLIEPKIKIGTPIDRLIKIGYIGTQINDYVQDYSISPDIANAISKTEEFIEANPGLRSKDQDSLVKDNIIKGLPDYLEVKDITVSATF